MNEMKAQQYTARQPFPMVKFYIAGDDRLWIYVGAWIYVRLWIYVGANTYCVASSDTTHNKSQTMNAWKCHSRDLGSINGKIYEGLRLWEALP